MSTDECVTVEVYWTAQGGNRFTISLSESEAWKSLDDLWAYDESPVGWSVERTMETVPVVVGEIHIGEGEAIQLDDKGHELSRLSYKPAKVVWNCPHCGIRHLTDQCDHPIERGSPASNPSIWFCEFGHGIALVKW